MLATLIIKLISSPSFHNLYANGGFYNIFTYTRKMQLDKEQCRVLELFRGKEHKGDYMN